MGTESGHLRCYYAATAAPGLSCPELTGTDNADVCIVGGGYTGVNAAIELAEKGYSVVLLEAHNAGWGCSGRNGGQVISGLASWDRLLRQLGPQGAATAWSRVRRRSTGSASYAFRLKPNSVMVPGSCQPG